MEAAMTLTPLLLSTTYKLIFKINLALEKPSKHKEERAYLAGRLSVIHKLLPRLKQNVPESAEVLAHLGDTLKDAHKLVLASQKWSMRRVFTRADVLTERFKELNSRIDSHLLQIQLCCQVADKTSSHSRTGATTGHPTRKRDVIIAAAFVLIGMIFQKPDTATEESCNF